MGNCISRPVRRPNQNVALDRLPSSGDPTTVNSNTRRTPSPALNPDLPTRPPQAHGGNRLRRAAVPLGAVQATASAASAQASQVFGSAKPLPKTMHAFAHPQHGKLNITQEPKAADSDQVLFRLKLQAPQGGASVETAQRLVIADRDPQFGNVSTMSYSDIDLIGMEGKGVGTALHAAIAATAQELGVQKVVVALVVTDAMSALCDRMGMKEAFPGTYEADSAALLRACRARSETKGWSRPQG